MELDPEDRQRETTDGIGSNSRETQQDKPGNHDSPRSSRRETKGDTETNLEIMTDPVEGRQRETSLKIMMDCIQ